MAGSLATPLECAAEAAPCGHCGLTAAPGDSYCCYGCELAAAIAAEGARDQAATRAGLTGALLLSMAVMMLSLFLYAEDVYGAPPEAGMGWLRDFYRLLSALLTAPVLWICGKPLLLRAGRSLRAGRLSMDLLIVTGAGAAFALSLHAVATGRPRTFFDSASAALLLATFGRFLEATARKRASGALSATLRAAGSQVLAADGATPDAPLHLCSPATLQAGDRVRVAAEQVVPLDVTLAHHAEVDLAVLNGESLPVVLPSGSVVPAGAVPLSGSLEGIVTRPMRDSTLERLAAIARGLAARPSQLMRLADRFASALVPLTWALAFGALVYWAAAADVDRAIGAALAVLLAACPCSYGIAAPLVHWMTLRKALRHGVLVRDAVVLESLARVDAIALDKTGTVTSPGLTVADAWFAPGVAADEALALVAALEGESRHPVAVALADFARERGATPALLLERRQIVGRGIAGRDETGRALALGAPPRPPGGGTEAMGVVLTRDGAALARFVLREAIRPEARTALAALRALGVRPVLLTGDAPAHARPVAMALDLEVQAGLAPVEKVEALAALGPNASMVGDGLNDVPALAAAGPSFSLPDGSDLSRSVASVSLARPDLRLVPWSIALARRAVRLVRLMLAWSTAYNVVFVALAAAGALRPVFAGLSMLISSLSTLAFASRPSGWPAPPGERA